MMKILPMTSSGYSALRDELKNRIQEERPRTVERLRHAMSEDSNLSENSEYQAALAKQAGNESRIAELEDKLARAEIIDLAKQSGDIIRFGATVTIVDEDSKVRTPGRSLGNQKRMQVAAGFPWRRRSERP